MYILAIATSCFYGGATLWYYPATLASKDGASSYGVFLLSEELYDVCFLTIGIYVHTKIKVTKNVVLICFSFITKPILLKTSMKIILKMRLLSSYITKVL
jgi:hypothetical protein